MKLKLLLPAFFFFWLPVVSQANSLDYLLLKEDEIATGSWESFNDDTWDRTERRSNRWQLNLSPGYSFLGGYEYQGFEYDDGPAFQGALFYQVSKYWQVGIEGGYSFGHEHTENLYRFYGYDFILENKLDVVNAGPAFRWGTWMKGPWHKRMRPYVQAGGGWYQINETYSLKVEANQFQYRDQLDERSNDYAGAHLAGGVEVEVYPQGVVGFQLMYHQVFSPDKDLQMVQPKVQFSYLF